MIKIKNVVKEFKNCRVLKNISLTVEEGEIVAIIGPSGCGKSTILKCINGLETVTSGEIIVDGLDISSQSTNINKVREEIGIVFQQFNLFPHMTVKENIMLAPLKVKKVSKNEAEITAMELLEKVGLLNKMDSYPYQLSGGQSQRVAIARSLAMKPKIMLFDEPTSALDPKMTNDVLSVIKELKKDNITMVIVTHQMGFAQEIANRVLYVSGGKILENDTPDNVFKNPTHPETKEFLNNILTIEDRNE